VLLFSVLYGFWVVNYVGFNGDVMRASATQFLTLAEKQAAVVPRMVGHRLMGTSLLFSGDIAASRAHLDRAIALYDPGEHRRLATWFGQDVRVVILEYRSWSQWLLGYPHAALVDAERAVKDAREIGEAATLMSALCLTSLTYILCGEYATANAASNEAMLLADEKGAALWRAWATLNQGAILLPTSKAMEAFQHTSAGIAAWRSTGAKFLMPFWLSNLALEYVQLGQLDNAWRSICDAMMPIKNTETMFEAEVHRIAGEIALLSPSPDAAKAEAYFECALAVARQQQARSWELRAAMSLARLWRDQGKPQQARELLAPVYGWFTEGFDTRDLKEAKALLEELSA
jgi:predicted ATPase